LGIAIAAVGRLLLGIADETVNLGLQGMDLVKALLVVLLQILKFTAKFLLCACKRRTFLFPRCTLCLQRGYSRAWMFKNLKQKKNLSFTGIGFQLIELFRLDLNESWRDTI